MKVQRLSLSDQVKEAILERIVKGEYKPGDRLLELTIAKEFETSQVTVREALSKLEAMQFLESKPHRGTFVREITDQEIGESTMVRGVLEEAAAATGAKVLQGKVPELRAEVRGMLEAFERKDLDSVAKHNFNFHRMIIHSAENSVLIKVWESLAFEVKSRICAHRGAQAVVLMGIKSCEPIVDALERGDGATAGRLLRRQAEHCGTAQVTGRFSSKDIKQALVEAGFKVSDTSVQNNQ